MKFKIIFLPLTLFSRITEQSLLFTHQTAKLICIIIPILLIRYFKVWEDVYIFTNRNRKYPYITKYTHQTRHLCLKTIIQICRAMEVQLTYVNPKDKSFFKIAVTTIMQLFFLVELYFSTPLPVFFYLFKLIFCQTKLNMLEDCICL